MTQIKLRRDTSANFTSKNPVLGAGEPAYETDTKKLKIGDGTTTYNTLAYFAGGGGSAEFNVVQPLKLVDGTLTLQVDEQTIQVQNGKLVANLDELGNEVNDLSGRVTAAEADILGKQDKIVTLTKEAYEALTEKEPNTIYMIEGETSADLPIASATSLGGIKVGDNLSITADGTLSAPQSLSLDDLGVDFDRGIDVPLGVQYTCPVNGYFMLQAVSTAALARVELYIYKSNGSRFSAFQVAPSMGNGNEGGAFIATQLSKNTKILPTVPSYNKTYYATLFPFKGDK